VSVSVYYNEGLVEQLAACGITARRQRPPGTPASGFVLRTATPRAQGGGATHVVAVQGHVTITRQQLRLPAPEAAASVTSTSAASEPRTALELAEDCARLRRDNQRLTDEVARLRAEVDRLTTPRQSAATELDDSARRFSLLELE
jgi:hypothetical protein